MFVLCLFVALLCVANAQLPAGTVLPAGFTLGVDGRVSASGTLANSLALGNVPLRITGALALADGVQVRLFLEFRIRLTNI